MGHISPFFVEKVATIAAAGDPPDSTARDAIYRCAGLDPAARFDQAAMIRDTDFFALFEMVADRFPDGRSIAIRVGAAMQCDDYGAFGLAFKSAVDLRGSFLRVERYGRIVTSIANFDVNAGTGSTLMAVRRGADTRLGLTMTNELAVAAATALSREVCVEDFAPVAVHFSHSAPADLSAYEAHFRCPLHFGADRDGLEIGDYLLRVGNRLGDARISAFFDTHLEQELAGLSEEEQLDRVVQQQVAQALSEGVPTIAEIAARMHMSARTLQRRLSDQGFGYQDIVDTARRELAERLLVQTDFALAEVAFLTGYSEQSTFTRAFRRWHAKTPTDYRRDNTPT